jgi:hypothetical protein
MLPLPQAMTAQAKHGRTLCLPLLMVQHKPIMIFGLAQMAV